MKKNILAIIAVLPFLSVLLHHYLAVPDGMVPTGFIQYDMAYYPAEGREIFEAGGNGLAYANPYNPGSPTIYFHWLIWILGFVVKVLHFDPGLAFVTIGIISGLLMSRVTYSLVESILPTNDFQDLLFLIIMWGGGLLVFAAVSQNIADGKPLLIDLLRYDPGNGMWFLNWGRNLLFGTEALYHVLVASIWLNLVKEKWGYAVLSGLVLAATHPFSGLQFLLILVAYLGFLIIVRRQTISVLYPGFLIAGLLSFLAYYFVFLNSFESHRIISESWKLAWTLSPSRAMAAYLLPFVFASRNILEKRRQLKNADWLFMISFMISFLLANHQWFTTPHQPLHFTRGYVWTPLALLALPVLQKIFIRISQDTKPFAASLILTGIMFFLALDNLGFLYTIWSGVRSSDLYLLKEEKAIFEWLDEKELTGTLLYPNSPVSNYLVATYTEMDPYLGHWSLTPDLEQRSKMVADWMMEGGSAEFISRIDYLLIREDTIPSAFEYENWKTVRRSGKLILLQQEK